MAKHNNFQSGTLGAQLTAGSTTITFAAAPAFPTITSASHKRRLVIDPDGASPEVVFLTAYTTGATTGTVVRGQEGTTDATHASGTAWAHNLTAYDIPDSMVFDPSAVANLDIPIAGYEAVRIVGWLVAVTDGALPRLRVSNDGGGTFRSGAADYDWSEVLNISSSAFFSQGRSGGDTSIRLASQLGNAAGEYMTLDLQVVSPGHASARTSVMGFVVYRNTSGDKIHAWISGQVQTAEVNDALRIFMSTGNIASGHLAVYGYPAP